MATQRQRSKVPPNNMQKSIWSTNFELWSRGRSHTNRTAPKFVFAFLDVPEMVVLVVLVVFYCTLATKFCW